MARGEAAAPDSGFVVRAVSDDEFATFVTCMGTAFGHNLPPVWEDRMRADIGERAVAVFEADRAVGTSGWFPLELTVPGRTQVPVGYLVAVAVLPTHRRRGLMAAMTRRVMDDIRAAGIPVALLTASEAGIYGRFGFGAGTSRCHYELDKRLAHLTVEPPRSGVVRLVDAAESVRLVPELWDRARRARVGEVTLPPTMWSQRIAGDEGDRGGGERRFFVVYEEAGSVEGWADYRFVPAPEGEDGAAVEVGLLVATGPGGYVALVAYLLGIDLATTLRLRHRDPNEPLRHLLTDPRQLRVTAYDDDVWVRPMDVRATLAARRYAPLEGRLSLLVRDPLYRSNDGCYVLGVDGSGVAAVEGPQPPAGPVDLELDVAALGSVWMGGQRWSSLVRAGRAVEHVPGAAWRADALFAADEEPFATISL